MTSGLGTLASGMTGPARVSVDDRDAGGESTKPQRAGSTFTGDVSPDNVTWATVGQYTIPVGS